MNRMRRFWAVAFLALGAGLGMARPVYAGDATNTAADIVPADCGLFSTSLHLREQFDTVAKSNAVKRILDLNLVKMAWQQATSSGEYRQFLEALRMPEVQEAIPLVVDALSDEMFVFTDNELANLLSIVNRVQNRMNLMQLTRMGRSPSPNEILAEVLQLADKTKVPVAILGFKSTKHEAIKAHIEKLVKLAERCPVPMNVTVEKTAKGEFTNFELSLESQKVTDDQVLGYLQGPGQIDEESAKKLLAWGKSRKVFFSLGRHADYLILSIGPSLDHLKTLGEKTLAQSNLLDPIRKHMDKRLLSLGYVSKRWSELNGEQFQGYLDLGNKALVQFKDRMPPGLADRLNGDLKELGQAVEKALPTPTDMVSVARSNRGVETFVYQSGKTRGLDYSRKLDVLKYAGKSPLLAIAAATKDSDSDYETIVRFVKKAHGYWRDFGIGLVPEAEREKVMKLDAAIVELVGKFDTTTRTKMSKASNSEQGLMVVDIHNKFEGIPILMSFPKPMPMFQFGIVSTLKDGSLFEEGMGDYLTALDQFLGALPTILPETPIPPNFRIPRPSATPYGADGNMYFYAAAGILDRSTLPHAVVMPNLLILATSPEFSKQALKATPSSAGEGVVALDQPSATVAVFNPSSLWPALRAWYDLGETTPSCPLSKMKGEEKQMIHQTLDVAAQVLGTFKGATSRTFLEGEHSVTHTWAHFEDVK